MIIAYKLFEPKNGRLRSLVHGHPENGKRTRFYELDTWYEAEQGTPGFNVFGSENALIRYIPRFRVRSDILEYRKVEVEEFVRSTKNYLLYKKMRILV